jgi:cystathionine gamma-synthase
MLVVYLLNLPSMRQLGADVSMHSGTKYMAGHSDSLLGIATASPITKRGKELAPVLRSVQIDAGGVASPWDSWLTLRGLRTLQIRVERQSKSAQSIAEYLDQHDLVTAVHYPGLVNHPQHDVAKQQMHGGFGGVFSVELQDEIMATAFAGALRTIQRATSLGGTETLIEHRASIEPPGRVTSPPGLLRVSVGLEDVNDLIRDMEKALSIANQVVSESQS